MTQQTTESQKLVFMTVREVATLMRVSRMTVYRLLEAKQLPSVKIGSSFRVSQKAVFEYLKKNTTHIEEV